MNIRQIEAFHAVMETGSATHAGERLGISQPAVSKLLKSFAESCGFALFSRSNGRLVPTREARLVAAEVELLISGTERVERVAAAVRNREWGQITIAAMPALATRFLPQALSPFLKAQPDLHLTLQSRASPRIAELIIGQQVDVGLSVLPFDHPDIDAEAILRFDFMCFLPADHPLASKEAIGVEDLRNEAFISLERDDCSLMTIDRAFQIRGVQKRNRIEVPMSETACSFVANGVGVSILPPFIGVDYAQNRIVRRPLIPKTSMDIWVLTSSRRPLSLAAQQLVDFIRTALRPFCQQ
ncbi:LysR substrate-binding domain-containing protein [Microvirga pudoricolor]|uniref:LysR substrate-binding domain-containing protein n=1 Tax=Microvirga pudoricolor TaxID=2778729 RepID=UPI00194F933F|nr:LysR substrate-binding domain-containing protein [Microvirga pudoricolor]MBM6595137.1 LysR family transcriptional regulator [Microvirga pudoricolor]